MLAATLIGERSTELSMKAFQGGGGPGSLDDDLAELKAVFGQGRSLALGTTHKGIARDLRRFLDAHDAEVRVGGAARAAVLKPLVDHAERVLKYNVDRIHIEVVLRQLIDSYLELDSLRKSGQIGQTSLVAHAQRRGRTNFEVATIRGRADWLVSPTDQTGQEFSGFRSRLAAGNVGRAPLETGALS